MKKRKRKTRNFILVLLMILLSAIIVFCALQIKTEYTIRKEDADTFEELAAISTIITPDEIQTNVEELPSESDDGVQISESEQIRASTPAAVYHDVSLLHSKNEDCIGWVRIAGTALDYPVMFTPDEPQKYLRLNFYEKYSVSGVPFLDYRCSAEHGNLIIYGHNMKNGTMFAAVKDYRTDGFLRKHPKVILEMEDGVHVFEIFAAASVDKSDPWYDFIKAETKEDFDVKIQEILDKAMYKTNSIPVWGERLLTLSTCHKNMEINRMIVIAKETINE